MTCVLGPRRTCPVRVYATPGGRPAQVTASFGTSKSTECERGETPGEMSQARKPSSSSSRLSGAPDGAIDAHHAVPAPHLPETAARDSGKLPGTFLFLSL